MSVSETSRTYQHRCGTIGRGTGAYVNAVIKVGIQPWEVTQQSNTYQKMAVITTIDYCPWCGEKLEVPA